MSIFNKPYRTDEEMKTDEKERKRRQRVKNRGLKDMFAEEIFKVVFDAIETGDKVDFSKEEMVQMVSPKTVRPTKSERGTDDWLLWEKYCNTAIRKIRVYFWGDGIDKQMFNYVRDEERYYLVPFDKKLGTNVIYDAYQRKMEGIQEKQREIATSAYRGVLKLDKNERKRLIVKLRKQHLLNGDK